ncbi:MAG TPA: hypothetical protein VKF32_13990 [Thermoanaerobaculia bacterium]|nr:hypothetical protein [Thermoanaerobaculia bacterium]
MIHFVLNSHGLGFEKYSMLCVKSLRAVCGAGPRVSVFCPDNVAPPPPIALDFYARHGVEVLSFHNELLPARLGDLGAVPARHLTFNKVYAMQGIAPGERRVFLDADIVFLKDPCPYFESISEASGASPVNTPEAFGGDWGALYDAVGVPFPKSRVEVWTRYVYGDAPEPEKVSIPPYFSSGVVYATAASTVPDLWLRMCRELEGRLPLVPRTFFIDQIALSVALEQTARPYRVLPRAFNTTYEIWRFTPDCALFHYVGFDALAAAIARFPEVARAVRPVVKDLAREDGLDLRLGLLTEIPRLYRRSLGILARTTEQVLGFRLPTAKERT